MKKVIKGLAATAATFAAVAILTGCVGKKSYSNEVEWTKFSEELDDSIGEFNDEIDYVAEMKITYKYVLQKNNSTSSKKTEMTMNEKYDNDNKVLISKEKYKGQEKDAYGSSNSFEKEYDIYQKEGDKYYHLDNVTKTVEESFISQTDPFDGIDSALQQLAYYSDVKYYFDSKGNTKVFTCTFSKEDYEGDGIIQIVFGNNEISSYMSYKFSKETEKDGKKEVSQSSYKATSKVKFKSVNLKAKSHDGYTEL